jgi:tryptophan synthase alpha chain
MNPLLPFLMAGDPSLEALPGLLAELKRLGISAVEIGLPHSDPIADGPVLQAAAQRSVGRGVTSVQVLKTLAGLTESPDIVLFTYLNPLLQLGVDRLLELLEPTPIKSLLVVDLPSDEEPEWEAKLRLAGYPLIPLLAPTTDLARAQKLLLARPDPGPAAPFAQRFAYVVARLGVTGTGVATDLLPIRERVAALQSITERPLAVGFGLSDADSLEAIRRLGATPVVGSALVLELAAGQSLHAAISSRL